MPPVLARAPETTFLLVGAGPLAPPLQERVRRLGVADRVVFAGARSDVAAILRSSDVSVLTSSREGFSNVVIESLAAGLPMVATDVGGNAEAIEAGLSGFLFEPGDVAALSSRVLDLLLDEDLRSRMGQAARRRAERFSLERAARATLDLYDQLLAGRA
jgi:glycosyltransferase involved in cell wall biosynthesis